MREAVIPEHVLNDWLIRRQEITLPPEWRWLTDYDYPRREDMPETTDEYPIADVQEPRPPRTDYDPFDYHATSDDCRVQLAAMRGCFKFLRNVVLEDVPSCRERSLALTHLQDSLMSAIQAIVFTHPDSVPVIDPGA